MTIECGSEFTDPGALATDDIDGNISVNSSNDVNVTEVGTYEVIYTATDSSGNTSSETRTVVVQDTTPPVIWYCDVGDFNCNWFELYTVIELGCENYNPEPVIGYDETCGGAVELAPVITGDEIDCNTVGYYTQTYTVTDDYGNSYSEEITFQVIDPLSISESNIENVTLFPNPSSENIYIKNLKGDELITMYDLLGRVVEIPFQN